MFLPFVNLDMIFSFFGSSWKYDKSGGAFVCTYTCGQNIVCLYKKQSDCDIDLFVSLNAMQAW